MPSDDEGIVRETHPEPHVIEEFEQSNSYDQSKPMTVCPVLPDPEAMATLRTEDPAAYEKKIRDVDYLATVDEFLVIDGANRRKLSIMRGFPVVWSNILHPNTPWDVVHHCC